MINTWRDILDMIEIQGYVHLEGRWYFLHNDLLVHVRPDSDWHAKYIILKDRRYFESTTDVPKELIPSFKIRVDQYKMLELL